MVLTGPPGSGKGTQAKLLCERLKLIHFSTGDILRDAVEKNTREGRRAKKFMTNGQLVPDEIVNEIVRARFRGMNGTPKFVMDGYPRTVAQAMSFDALLEELKLPMTAAVALKVEDDEIVRRLGQRWTCPNAACGAVFNAASIPPRVAGKCDHCQSDLYQRPDDKPDTIRKRLQVFHDQHDDILRHYQKQGFLVEVPGQGDIETIYGKIVKSL